MPKFGFPNDFNWGASQKSSLISEFADARSFNPVDMHFVRQTGT
jgi:hypothetical protein